jgi:dTDP-4-amino-4,6-dideoxygalactose transaminase
MKDENTESSPGKKRSRSLSFRFHHSSFILPPSFFPRVPLGVPYWTQATYQSIARCVATAAVTRGSHLAELRVRLSKSLGVSDVLLCASGSMALELALRACAVGLGDEVVVPAFCCSAVVRPIFSLGGVPLLADVGPELNITAATVEPVLGKRTRAIIVPHLFGNPVEIGAIVELARQRRIWVIDDAAQALGATIEGRLLGGFGDIGILSFGAEKVCSGIGGGALIISNQELRKRIDSGVLAIPSAWPALRDCLSTVCWRRWRRWALPVARALWRSSQNGPGVPAGPYQRSAMANLKAAVALSLVHSVNENIAARRTRVRLYHNLLGGNGRLQLIPHRIGSACLSQVVRITSRRRDDDLAASVIERLAKEGFEVQGSYVPIHLLPGNERCLWDQLSYVEKIWANLIELPCEPTVALDDVERIAEIVLDSLRNR